ncbi:ficolin-1-like [Anopheles nili]|uniref:ficolin-1-like n=1 Tax=Anopheles nili TaxID=185578 RepID=UPI00237AC2C1|nr:ficolin-1-like [Anopheles nili]
MRPTVILFAVLIILQTTIDCNVSNGFGYEMLSARLDSIQGMESDLVTSINDTQQQLSKLVNILTRLTQQQSVSAGQQSVSLIPGQPTSIGSSCRALTTSQSGMYRIEPDFPFNEPMTVLCNQEFMGGGWTVIQRRMDGSVNFMRDWADYKRGFGTLHGEFWLGLDKIHRLTNAAPHELAVLLEDFDGVKSNARYDRFRIGAESVKYNLLELGKCGPCPAGDSMRIHLNESFSTYDNDNSKASFNCAARFKGAWWFYKCHRSHLNGEYLRGKLTKAQDSLGLMWIDFRGEKYSLKATTMMIRPI